MNQLSPEKIKLIEEIFDAHSYHINDDLDSLQYVAGSSVIVNKVDFTKAVTEILSKTKGSEWVSVENIQELKDWDSIFVSDGRCVCDGYFLNGLFHFDNDQSTVDDDKTITHWHSKMKPPIPPNQ